MKNYEEKLENILRKYDSNIGSIQDLIGDDEPSKLFFWLANKFYYLLDNDPDKALSKTSAKNRDFVNKVVRKVGPLFLSGKQIIEDRNKLLDPQSKDIDPGIVVPDEPVIWASTHAFKDDALGAVLAIPRNAYFLFGSLPQFYNTVDGLTSWLNGVVLINRKNDDSKKASIDKCIKTLDLGKDLIIYPEGVWNKMPSLLSLELWPGIYRIAKEKNVKIVPLVHYKREMHLKDKHDYMHTVIDDPISVEGRSEKEVLEELREKFVSWQYLMMEKYGHSTREAELGKFDNATDAWEDKLRQRIKTAERYDLEIETTADYFSKERQEYLKTWEDIANVENITKDNVVMIEEAKKKVKELKINNFQRRF